MTKIVRVGVERAKAMVVGVLGVLFLGTALAAVLFLNGCGVVMTVKKHNQIVDDQRMEYGKARAKVSEEAQEKIEASKDKWRVQGRMEMKAYFYSLLAETTPKDLVDFWRNVRLMEDKPEPSAAELGALAAVAKKEYMEKYAKEAKANPVKINRPKKDGVR